MSIRLKLTSVFLAIAAVPVLLVTAITYNNYKSSLESTRISQLQDVAAFKAGMIELYLAGLKTNIEILQNAYIIRKNIPMMIRLLHEPASPDVLAAKKGLDELLEKTASAVGLADIMLVSPSGKIVYSSNPAHSSPDFLNSLPDPEQTAFKEGENKIYFSDVFINKVHGNKRAIMITAPVFDANHILNGVIAFEAGMDSIDKLILDTTGLGATGETLLGKRTGSQVVFLHPLRHDTQAALKRKTSIGAKISIPVQEAVQGRQGAGESIDYRGRRVIAAWRYIPSMGWGLVAKIDADEAFADVFKLRNRIFIILAIIFVLGIVIAFSTAQSIAEPIKKLSRGALIIGSGNLDYKIAIDRTDEIGQLSKAFDKMTQDLKRVTASRDELNREIDARKAVEEVLKKVHDGLEAKVLQRTAELTRANEQLIHEIAERKKNEGEIRARNILLKLASQTTSQRAYLHAVVKLLRAWSRYSSVGIRILHEDGKVPYESYLGFRKGFWEKENWLSVQTDKCACIRVVRGEFLPEDAGAITPNGSFHCGDIAQFLLGLTKAQQARFRGTCTEEGYASITIIPLRYKEKIIGAIHLADKRKEMLTNEQLAFLELLVPRIGEDIAKFSLSDKIHESNELLAKIFASAHLCIVYLDPQFNFIRVNDAYARACGLPQEYFIGKNHFDLYPHEENEAIFRKVVETGEPFTAYTKPFVFPDHPEWGTTYWDWSLHPVKDGRSKVEGLIFFLVDVTRRKHAETELTRVQNELNEKARLSDIGTLAATVAHELRNPLAAINMAAYNIRRKAQNPLLDKHIHTIEKKITESDQIINNLLFYSRIKPPRHEKVYIHGIIEECLDLVKSRYREKKVTVTADIRGIKKVTVEADPLQMKEVFCNIFDNAYGAIPGRRGRIDVTAQAGDGEIKVQVKDDGEGISEEALQRVFDPFFTTKAKGTGLGLTVCKQIVNLHGGSIEIVSKKGDGTAVNITLPKSENPHEEENTHN